MSPKVVILGAGYAGVSAATRLAKSDADVTVVNPRSEFVERIRLHQYVVGGHAAVVPLESVLPGAAITIGTAVAIEPQARRIRLDTNETLDYDYLIYAVGSDSRTHTIPGAGAHARTLGTLEDARITRHRLEELATGSVITIVGGGLTGIETAAELAESTRHSIRLVTDQQLAPTVSDRGRRRIHGHLTSNGVEIHAYTPVVGIHSGRVELADGRSLASDLTILASTVGVPEVARASSLDTDSRGALTVHNTLVSSSDTAIVGAGDAATLTQSPLRMSCQAAIPSGIHAAETVLHLIAARDPKEVRRKFAAQCISLGRKNALFQSVNSYDTPRPRAVLTGRPAALIKEQLCSSTMWFGHRGPFSYSWS
ncbi:NAD(P)/FAD-dependent oxidoreductase [Rhodococcus sovatensis]|uniref:FAD-dependent oxidoreductase n=1 Tax=Rhodococcus sovatensis TaxID=1805840 RepID=A0ABZ2PGU2_9NOCA